MRAHPNAITLYARARGLSERAAADELQRIAAVAKQSEDGRRLRYRSRLDRLDVTMNLADGMIVAVSVRDYRGSGGGAAERRKQERLARRRRERGEE